MSHHKKVEGRKAVRILRAVPSAKRQLNSARLKNLLWNFIFDSQWKEARLFCFTTLYYPSM